MSSAFAPGDRIVWSSPEPDPERHAATFPGSTTTPPRLVFRGEYVADGPAPYVTVRYDGETTTAQVFADQLRPELAP